MENRLSNLISALTELTDDLKDVATGDAVQNDGRLELGGFYNPEAGEKKKNEALADSIAEKIDKNAKSRELESDRDDFSPRKILSKIIPTNIVSFDKTALKQLSSIMPISCCSVIKEACEEKNKDRDDDFDLKQFGGVLLGVLTALGVGAMIANIEEIKNWLKKIKDFNIKDMLFGDNRIPIENLPVAVKTAQKIKQRPAPLKTPVGKEVQKLKNVSDIVKSSAIANTNKKIITLADDLVRLTAQIDDLGKLPVADTKAFRTKWNEKTLNIKDNFAKINKEIDAVFDATKNRPELAQAARNLQSKTIRFISQNRSLLTASADDIIKTPTLVNDYITKANTTSKNLAAQLTKYGDEMAAIDKNIAELRKLGSNVKTVVDGEVVKIRNTQTATTNRVVGAIDDLTTSTTAGGKKIEATANAATKVIDKVMTQTASRLKVSEDAITSLQQTQRAASTSVASTIDNVGSLYNDIKISADDLNRIIAAEGSTVSRVTDDVADVSRVLDKSTKSPGGGNDRKWGKILDDAKKSLSGTKDNFFKTVNEVSNWVGNFMGPDGPIQTSWRELQKTKVYKEVARYGKKFLTAGKMIMKVVLLPIMAVWSGVEAGLKAVKGYEEDGITKAITEATNSLIDFWIFDTIRVIRDIGTWILGAIGLENFEKGFDEETDEVMDEILKSITAVGGLFKSIFTLDLDRALEEGSNLRETAYGIIAGTVSAVVSGVVNIVKDVFNVGDQEKPYNFKKEILDPIWENIKNTVLLITKLLVDGVHDGFPKAKEWIQKTINDAWEKTSTWFKELFDMESHLNNAKNHARNMSKSWGMPDWMTDSLFGKETKKKPGGTVSKTSSVPVPEAANNLRKTGLVSKSAIDSWTKLPLTETPSEISKYLKNTGVTLDGKQVKSWEITSMQPADVDKLINKLDDVVQSPGSTGKLDRQFAELAGQMRSRAEEKQRNPRLAPNTIPLPTIPQGESFETGPTFLRYQIRVLEDKLKMLDHQSDQKATSAQILRLRKQLNDANKSSMGFSLKRPPDDNLRQTTTQPIKRVVSLPTNNQGGLWDRRGDHLDQTLDSSGLDLKLTKEEQTVLTNLTKSNKQLAQSMKTGEVEIARSETTGNLMLKYKNMNKSGEIISSGAYEFEKNASIVREMLNTAGSYITGGSKSILDATQPEFPRRESPAAWEYIRDAGKEINAGSKRLYNQAVEFNKQSREISKTSKTGEDKLTKKVEEMVVILGENSEIQRKTLEALQQHGLIDKQGDTVVNNGGNSTTVNNMTVDSDIMSFRERVLGRLQPK